VSAAMNRGLVAGASVVIAAAIGVVTNIATDRPGLAWWVSLGALLVIGVGAQVWLTSSEGRQGNVTASGAGSVAVGGTTYEAVRTHTRGSTQSGSPISTRDAITATGIGSIAIGGDARGELTTDTEGEE